MIDCQHSSVNSTKINVGWGISPYIGLLNRGSEGEMGVERGCGKTLGAQINNVLFFLLKMKRKQIKTWPE